MNVTELFLIAMLLVFALPYLVWRLGRTDYWAPLVVVQIVTGIVLGPGVLGALAPAAYGAVFTPAVIGALNGIAWWAVMLFVWIAGIELDLRQAWVHRRESGVTAALALGVPLLLGSAAALLLAATGSGWVGALAAHWQFVLGIGMACAVTALPILILLMEKLAILRRPLGQRILRYASVDDVAIWGVLALILVDWQRVGRQALFLLALVVAAWLMRKLMRRIPEADRWFVGLVWLAACALGADWSGLHYMVGAFLAGVVMDAGWFSQQQLDTLRHNVLLVVMPVFFLSTGLKTNWAIGGGAVFFAAALLLAASVAGKLIGTHIAGRVLGWQPGEATLIGWLLQTKALIMIIFANVLLDKQIITGASFTALLLMAVASTMLTVPMVTPRLARLQAVVGRNSQCCWWRAAASAVSNEVGQRASRAAAARVRSAQTDTRPSSTARSRSGRAAARWPASDAAVPLVAFVLPVPALAAADGGEAVDQLDGADVLGLLVAQLAFDPAAQRRAVGHRQRPAVQRIGQDGLRMHRIVHVDAFVVAAVAAGGWRVHRIEAAEDDVLRARQRLRGVQQQAQRHAGPLADAAPALDAVVARDLRARRQRLQLRQ